ncbi:MAG: hypothetical protein LBR84_01420 [Tannerella sp.]|nr:hypothetical protein [Tannerella sp.]
MRTLNSIITFLAATAAASCLMISCTGKGGADASKCGTSCATSAPNGAIVNDFRFNGYTTHWQDVYQHRYRYGNLFKMNIPDINAAIAQVKADIAEQLGLPGLRVQEGFVNAVITGGDYATLENPTEQALNEALKKGNVLVLAGADSDVGKKLSSDAKNIFPCCAGGHQTALEGYSTVDAFVVKRGKNSIYAVVGHTGEQLDSFCALLENAAKTLAEYDLKRGWFAAATLIKSVTCTPGTPIDVMGRGLNEGNSWFVFDGYMEFLAKDDIAGWAAESGLPIVTDVGSTPVYRCSTYDDLQVQMMFKPQDWIDYAHSKDGYVFRRVYDNKADSDKLAYDGYFATPGNARQINEEDKPFILTTGDLLSGAVPFMVLFNKKGETFDSKAMWDDIMSRRSAAVTEGGFVMGAAQYRQTLQLLVLDRVYAEEYFGDRINLETTAKGNTVSLAVTNTYPQAVKATLKVNIPPQLTYKGEKEITLNLAAGATQVLNFSLETSAEAMNRRNVVAFTADWGGKTVKSTVALLELPPAISGHELLYGVSSGTKFPVTVHNFSAETSVPVKISVNDSEGKSVYESEQQLEIPTGEYRDAEFELKLPAGSYNVITSALGLTFKTQLGIEDVQGTAKLTQTDINGDGIDEYILENEQVRATLICTGARVIEYFVKKKNDNVLFKLWPEKPEDDRRPYRERGFYPFGGFEDFLGQPSIETHKIYKAEVLKNEGEYVSVKMTANYFGNSIEKVYTLYGNTPLLEARYALKMINPELNVIGPQPIYEVGKKHGPEDVFVIPETDGLKEYRMKMERFFGRKLILKEGWNGAYDTVEDIGFVSAYPVNRPFFLHMWMNHPANGDAHYYYAEFQPWTPMFMRTTTYFSYYMWADAGSWQKALQALRDRNLITER